MIDDERVSNTVESNKPKPTINSRSPSISNNGNSPFGSAKNSKATGTASDIEPIKWSQKSVRSPKAGGKKFNINMTKTSQGVQVNGVSMGNITESILENKRHSVE